jgi:hypothetical protein
MIRSIPAVTVPVSLSESGMLGHPFQQQAMLQKEINYMANRGEDINDEKKSAESRADFIRLAGIGPELAEFLTEFVEKPDRFHSMPFERRREIETQMDAIIASFGKR